MSDKNKWSATCVALPNSHLNIIESIMSTKSCVVGLSLISILATGSKSIVCLITSFLFIGYYLGIGERN